MFKVIMVIDEYECAYVVRDICDTREEAEALAKYVMANNGVEAYVEEA